MDGVILFVLGSLVVVFFKVVVLMVWFGVRFCEVYF